MAVCFAYKAQVHIHLDFTSFPIWLSRSPGHRVATTNTLNLASHFAQTTLFQKNFFRRITFVLQGYSPHRTHQSLSLNPETSSSNRVKPLVTMRTSFGLIAMGALGLAQTLTDTATDTITVTSCGRSSLKSSHALEALRSNY